MSGLIKKTRERERREKRALKQQKKIARHASKKDENGNFERPRGESARPATLPASSWSSDFNLYQCGGAASNLVLEIIPSQS